MKSLLLISSGFFSFLSHAVLAEISVSKNYNYYYVYPYSKTEILSSLNNATPISENGEKFHGHAYSGIKWNFSWKYNKRSCWISSANVNLTTTYTLPKLETDVEEVNVIWNQWYPNLEIHENGHHKFAVEIANKIESAILDMPPEATCNLLEQSANRIGHRFISELKKLNKQYDDATDHGATQGASLFSYL